MPSPLVFRSAVMIAASLFLSAGPIVAGEEANEEKPPIRVEKIWDRAPHNAFTDLTQFEGRYFCTFREGTGHVPGEDGTIRVLVSRQGEHWESFDLLEEEGVDLRDPKLSVTPDGRLMLLMGGSYYDGKTILRRDPRVAFLEAGAEAFGSMQPIRLDEAIDTDFDWLWRVTWREQTGYGVVYQMNRPAGEPMLHLVRTNDGVDYETVHSFDVGGRPNEATLRFLDDGTMLMLLRREEGNRKGYLGKAQAPYTEWDFSELPVRLGGPNLLVRADGTLIAGTRKYAGPRATILARVTLEGDFEPLHELPSGGDTSYPGFLVTQDELWVSYYASHEGKAAIFLARIPLERLPGSSR